MENGNQEPRPTSRRHWLDAVIERLEQGEDTFLVFGALPVNTVKSPVDTPQL